MKIITTTLIFFAFCFTNAQKYTFQSTSYAYKIKEAKDWGKAGENWSSKIETKVNIVFDLENDKVFVDSSSPQLYILKTFLHDNINSKGNNVYQFLAIDKEFKPCKIMFIFSKDNNSSHQIYFIYNDFKFYYNCFSLSNFFED